MNQFNQFFSVGFFHIVDVGALDHILFLLAIITIYDLSQWKKIIWVITSFTIAHSLSLALSLMDAINLSSHLVEFLIACTIAIACIENLFLQKLHRYRILVSGFFGLIHGLGFSTALKSLFDVAELNLFETLLPFNLGIECGQLVIISFILMFLMVIYSKMKIDKVIINKIISVPVLVMALFWMYERLIDL